MPAAPELGKKTYLGKNFKEYLISTKNGRTRYGFFYAFNSEEDLSSLKMRLYRFGKERNLSFDLGPKNELIALLRDSKVKGLPCCDKVCCAKPQSSGEIPIASIHGLNSNTTVGPKFKFAKNSRAFVVFEVKEKED